MINRLKNLLWNIGITCCGTLMMIIEILITIPLLLWTPIAWLSTWIMIKIQDYDCCTVFAEISIWYLDKVLLSYIEWACGTLWKIFVGTERPDDHFRELTMERLGF